MGRRRVSFAFVALKAEHVLLGFEYSAWMDDRDGLLPDPRRWATPQKGRFTKLRSVDDVPVDLLVALTREAARIATLPRSGRDALR